MVCGALVAAGAGAAIGVVAGALIFPGSAGDGCYGPNGRGPPATAGVVLRAVVIQSVMRRLRLLGRRPVSGVRRERGGAAFAGELCNERASRPSWHR